jgi:hypothetical protein
MDTIARENRTMAHTIYGYTFHADIYCSECGENLPDIDQEGNPKNTLYSWDMSQFDYINDYGVVIPPSCGNCHTAID